MSMLILINGTIGVGKTWISKCLASAVPDSVFIEGDTLGFASPATLQKSARSDFGLEAGIKLISGYIEKGVKFVIFDRSFDDREKLREFISRVGLPSCVFYLSASSEEITSRIRKRNRLRAEAEIIDSQRLLNTQRNNFGKDGIGIEINTDGLSPEKIVFRIKRELSLNS